MSTLRRTTAAAALVLTASLPLAACSDDGDAAGTSATGDEASPEEALAAAKTALDATSGVRLTLATDDTPDSDAYLSEASGVIVADPPAFQGTASGTFLSSRSISTTRRRTGTWSGSSSSDRW